MNALFADTFLAFLRADDPAQREQISFQSEVRNYSVTQIILPKILERLPGTMPLCCEVMLRLEL